MHPWQKLIYWKKKKFIFCFFKGFFTVVLGVKEKCSKGLKRNQLKVEKKTNNYMRSNFNATRIALIKRRHNLAQFHGTLRELGIESLLNCGRAEGRKDIN